MTSLSAPLGTPAFFTPALFNIHNTADRLATSTARLSSGNRIVKASDDVAAFSVATRLQSQLSGLKQATQNVAQGDSLLQVASGGLTQIQELLDSLKTLAVQSNSASLTNPERSFLQQQFTSYMDEIDRIASTTSFNSIKLLDGSLSGANSVRTETDAATKATGSITFSSNPTTGQTVVINGVTFTADTDFDVELTTDATVANLYTALNASTDTRLSKVKFTHSGVDQISFQAKAGGALGNNFVIDKATSTTSFTVGGAATNAANVYTLSGGEDDGLAIGSVKATGTIGDALVTTQSQTAASVALTITGTISNGELLRIDNGNGGLISFTFASAASTSTDIQIGSSTEETLQNAIDTITQYTEDNASADNYGLRQLEFSLSGSVLTIRNKVPGNATDLAGAALDISETLTNGSLSGSSFNNGTTTGINASGVTNDEFIGTIDGFTATYVSSNALDASVTVGDSTYTARISDTTTGSDTTIRFSSASGGYFDVRLDGGEGQAVSDQDTADDYISRVNAAFSTLEFYQERDVTNFSATGDFIEGSAKIQLNDFSNLKLNSISVTAPSTPGGDATIDLTINNKVFRASNGLGETIGAHESIRFVSLEDGNEFVTLTNGTDEQDLSDDDAAAAFEASLRDAFGLGEDGEGVSFQIGVDPADRLNVTVGNSSTDQLFDGVTPDITTQNNAADAQDVIDNASDIVQGFLATIGALQQRLTFASANISTTTEGVTAAKSNLADTDIVEESTNFAQETLKINAAVAVIAQAQNLQSSLLNLLHSGLNS